jgi:pimeloyl-ACP methyl ester carboxylesterase
MTVVFLHPIGLDGRSFQFVTDPRLRDAVRYDMLWHGERERPTEPLTMHSIAQDILDNIPGRLDLVGVSMGGSVAQEIALNWPGRLRSAVIACSSAGGGGGVVHKERAAKTQEEGMEGMLSSTLERWFVPEAREQGDAHPGVAYARRRLLDDDAEMFAATWLALGEADFGPRLHELTQPITVLHAESDASVSRERNEKLAADISSARLRVIPGSHMVHLAEPEAFAAAVVEHLEWVDSLENA